MTTSMVLSEEDAVVVDPEDVTIELLGDVVTLVVKVSEEMRVVELEADEVSVYEEEEALVVTVDISVRGFIVGVHAISRSGQHFPKSTQDL